MTQLQRQRVVLSLIGFLACAFSPAPAPAQGWPARGAWSRSARANGETWIYRFTVTDGAGATASMHGGAPLGGGEARRVDAQRGDPARSAASVRRLPAAPPADDGGAAADVDLAVERAYTKDAAGGGGSEVATPEVGQTVYFYVDYSLSGVTGVRIISRRAIFDDQDFCHTTETTSAGSYSAWCATGWTATAGDHTLRWDFDYNNQLTESNENNNSATAMWTSQTAPVDLEAQRAYLQTAPAGEGSEVTTPGVGQTVYLYVDFRIVGTGDAIVADRRAVLDGDPYCSFTGTAAPGDYYAWCTDGWPVTAGTHTLRWDFDFNSSLAESNENNNSASVMWTSAAAGSVDLEAQRAYLNTMTGGEGDEVTTPAVGQAVYFHLDFRLIGSGDAAVSVERRAVLDGVPFCTFTGMPTPGDYLTWCIDPWTATAGHHTLRWDLDFNNTVAETDENNNSASTMWTSGGTTCSGDCDGNGVVRVNELITMVNDALSDTLVCDAGDTDNDGKISVNEIVGGVDRALNGCG